MYDYFLDLDQILQDRQIAKEALTTRGCRCDILLHFSKHANYDRVARCLGFTQMEIIDITRDAPTVEKKVMAVLNQWLRKTGLDATYYSLANAFFQMKDLELADRVLKYHLAHPFTEHHVSSLQVYPERVCSNWNDLNEDQKQEQEVRLLEEYRTVNNAYSNVIVDIEELFEESKINPRKVKMKLLRYCEDRSDSELANADEMDLIFCFIARRTTCIDYCLLEDVVNKFENDRSKKALQDYETKHLIPYLSNSLYAIPSDALAADASTSIQASLKLRDEIVPTGNEAKMLECRLAKLLEVSIKLAGYNNGCIELLFYIPKVVYDSTSPDTPLRRYVEWNKESQSYIITADITTIL